MTCPQCEQTVDSFHPRSHVLPDWMYKDSYSENHKIIHVDMNTLNAKKEQSATHGTYWCCTCETTSSRFDTYASLVLTTRSTGSPEHTQITKRILSQWNENIPGVELWTGINFKSLQNFVLACILRGHLHVKTENKNILGDKHFKIISSLYKDLSNVDDESYPILVSRSPEEDEHKHWSFLPHRTKVFEHNAVMFRAGGFQFQIIVSNHAKSNNIMLGRLTKSGELPMIVDHYKNTGSYKSSQEKLATVVRNYPSEKLRIRKQ